METLAALIKVTFPNYLKSLFIPESLEDIAKMHAHHWLGLAPLAGVGLLLVYLTYRALKPDSKKGFVNLDVQKDKSKVADVVEIEDLGNKTSYCRCWRSKKFPLCDGSHNEHNKCTGDNVGPLVVKRRVEIS